MSLRLPIVVPPLKLGNVSRKHLRGNDMVSTVQRPLELRPKALNGVRMRGSVCVLSGSMNHGVMLHVQELGNLLIAV